jgi:hypothetical protein
MANIFKKRARQLMIEGSKHHKKHNRSMKVMLYLICPFGFFLCLFIYLTETRQTMFHQWASLGLMLMFLGAMLVAYFFDKGYRHRDKITEEDYASLGYKPMSASQLGWCIVIGVAVTNLNKYYLHWF